MQRLEEYEDRKSWLFLNLNPPLSPNLIWCEYSVLICSLLACWLLNITYQMTELEIVTNIRVVALLVSFRIILNHQIWDSVAKVMIQILKCIQSESESKFASSHPLIFSLSIYLSVFDIILDWSLPNQNGFIEIWILLVPIWCYLSDLLWSSAEHLPQSMICSN